MPVIVKVHGESTQLELWLEVSLEIDAEAMDERQLMSLKSEQNLILGYNVKERGGHRC